MAAGILEHANLSVSDPERTAQMLADVFGWHIRWRGDVLGGAGHTIHVGSEDSYLALYRQGGDVDTLAQDTYRTIGGLNHIGVVVEDIDATEARVTAAGYTPVNHADYEPGRRFYFDDHDGIEFEVVAYD